jgi:hypothetical protein
VIGSPAPAAMPHARTTAYKEDFLSTAAGPVTQVAPVGG